jgi:thiol-disulfide isomerase/thioredoxin
MVAGTKKKSKTRSASNSVDVNGAADIPKLVDMLKKNKFVIVLIWADYCGHCHRYKDDVWNKLSSNKNRKAGLASIHYDQLETTPPSIPKKVSGYPTVLFVGNNGKPVEFKDKSGSNTTEYSKSRDLEEMTRISESEDPESLLEDVHQDETMNTPPLTQEAEELTVDQDPEDVLNSIAANRNTHKPKSRIVAPNFQEDMLNSQGQNKSTSVEKKSMEPVTPKSGGGSLYKALVGMFRQRQATRSTKLKRGKQTRRATR